LPGILHCECHDVLPTYLEIVKNEGRRDCKDPPNRFPDVNKQQNRRFRPISILTLDINGLYAFFGNVTLD